jgi:peroxiredoxin
MPAPFVLLDTHGAPHALADSRGAPLLAVFFKTTCPTCMVTFPYLERLHQVYSPPGLAVWGISQDTLDDTLAFASDQGATFPVLLDTTWDVSASYGIAFVPTLVLFNGQGEIVHQSVGFYKDNLNEIARLIAQDTGDKAVIIAPADDGKPPFKPG